MRKKTLFLIGAFVAFLLLTGFQIFSFKEANLRALDSFGPTLEGTCSGTVNECMWFCPACGAPHTANRAGHVTKIDGNCRACQYEVHETYPD